MSTSKNVYEILINNEMQSNLPIGSKSFRYHISIHNNLIVLNPLRKRKERLNYQERTNFLNDISRFWYRDQRMIFYWIYCTGSKNQTINYSCCLLYVNVKWKCRKNGKHTDTHINARTQHCIVYNFMLLNLFSFKIICSRLFVSIKRIYRPILCKQRSLGLFHKRRKLFANLMRLLGKAALCPDIINVHSCIHQSCHISGRRKAKQSKAIHIQWTNSLILICAFSTTHGISEDII